MHKADSLLTELRTKSFLIIEKYVSAFQKLNKENPENPLSNYLEAVMKEFPKEQAATAMDIVHKSIIEGVDNQRNLIIGIQQIGRETAIEIQQRVLQILSK